MVVVPARPPQEQVPQPVVQSQVVGVFVQSLSKEQQPNRQQDSSLPQSVEVKVRHANLIVEVEPQTNEQVAEDGSDGVAEVPGILLLGQDGCEECRVEDWSIVDVARYVEDVYAEAGDGKDVVQPVPLREVEVEGPVADLAEVVHEAGRDTHEVAHAHERLPCPEAAHHQGQRYQVREGADQGHEHTLWHAVLGVVPVIVTQILTGVHSKHYILHNTHPI